MSLTSSISLQKRITTAMFFSLKLRLVQPLLLVPAKDKYLRGKDRGEGRVLAVAETKW